ncbi:MAG: hypothetical protein HC896_13835 [Bacteroidales bacterium]|nr:hypothetical protein [Bacteroidales bacterium]
MIRSICQINDSLYCLAGFRAYLFDGTQSWQFGGSPKLNVAISLSAHVTPSNEIWIGTSEYGVFHNDGKNWNMYTVKDGITGNDINCIYGVNNKNIWVGSSKGLSYFDGFSWTPNFMGYTYPCSHIDIDKKGSFWFNSREPFQSVNFLPDSVAPETRVTNYSEKVSYFSNLTFSWKGIDPWETNSSEELVYSYRIDNENWSPFVRQTSKNYFKLPNGQHSFEVRARDSDLNIDHTPAKVYFTVIPPVYMQKWFLTLMATFVSLIAFLLARIFLKNKKIHELDTLKLKLFTNISHELRTPFNVNSRAVGETYALNPGQQNHSRTTETLSTPIRKGSCGW